MHLCFPSHPPYALSVQTFRPVFTNDTSRSFLLTSAIIFVGLVRLLAAGLSESVLRFPLDLHLVVT